MQYVSLYFCQNIAMHVLFKNDIELMKITFDVDIVRAHGVCAQTNKI